MNRTLLALSFGCTIAVLGAIAACSSDDANDSGSGGDAGPDTSASRDDGGGDGSSVGDGAGEDGGSDGGTEASCDAGAPPLVVFLDRAGGTYQPGNDDSTTNHSAIVSSSTTVLPWTIDDPSWTALVTCVRSKFAVFNVDVTDVDPGTSPHVEVVFAQSSAMPVNTLEVSTFTCAPVPNAVSFVNREFGDGSLACHGAAIAVAASRGLEHVSSCADEMTFDNAGCLDAGFTNQSLPCGTTTAAACMCGDAGTQNSYARLVVTTGLACP